MIGACNRSRQLCLSEVKNNPIFQGSNLSSTLALFFMIHRVGPVQDDVSCRFVGMRGLSHSIDKLFSQFASLTFSGKKKSICYAHAMVEINQGEIGRGVVF